MPPKAPKNPPKIVYPTGVKEISEDLGTDELVRRLKTCAQAFQNMGQDDNNDHYVPLAIQLAQDSFLEHTSKDVRLLIACCIADVFRVYAPDAPYKDPEQLKAIFLFLIKQLRGLQDPKEAAFKRYFYLLENLAWVKSFNICIELEDNQEIFCQLFTLMFTIVNDNHSTKVKNFMLDMMSPLISEADSISQELLDCILSNIIEPRKSQNRNAYNLARDLLRRTASTIEPYIQAFFNNALILGKSSDSEMAPHLYELVYELNSISPSVLLAVLPQLEFKLKSNDEKERLEVTRLLARMFSDKNSELATQHKALWTCFLGRFNDIGVGIRIRCVQYSMHFLLNHPELRADITEQLKLRQHDPEETVRYEVVMAIISAAKRDFTSISDELLNFVKERTLDKKFKIRKEALLGLSMIYKSCVNNPDIPESTRECVSWIKNKVLHVYYQTALEDRLLVERILHTCLVPYQLPADDRMKKLYQLYSSVDEHAVKAFNELLKCQNVVRHHARSLLDLIMEEKSEERDKQIQQKIVVLSKSLPEPVKAQEFLKKFNVVLQNETRIRAHMKVVLKADCSCKEAEDSVREILKKLGNPVMTNVFYMTVKQLLERIAPVLIDHGAVQYLAGYVDKALKGEGNFTEEIGSPKAPERGLRLLLILSYVFPGSFQYEDIFMTLVEFLKFDSDLAEITLRTLSNLVGSVEEKFPAVYESLLPALKEFAEIGTMKQAKRAIRCLNVLTQQKEQVFGDILEKLKQNLTLESPHYRTALVSIGHISFYCPDMYIQQMKSIVSKNVVKELLMQDKEGIEDSGENWCPEEELSEEAKAKIEGMKLMVRWLLGMKNNTNSSTSTLRLLTSVVDHKGDLMERGNICRAEQSWLRLTAGCCMLKIAQEPAYADIVILEQFQSVALLMIDECVQVRERFAQKLHKGLICLKLPLDYMAMFALGASETNRELKSPLKQYLLANINKRRDYLKQHTLTNEKLVQFLPDYIVPYTIHFLAHHPDYKKYDDVEALKQLKEMLWFIMEPLMTKSENYSFSFFKRLIDNIKQTKDAQNPEDDMQNMKLYAVCDLAIGVAMSKTTTFVLKEFPVEPILPKRLFTDVDNNYSNTKNYLPPELAFTPPKLLQRTGIDMDLPVKPASESTAGNKRGRVKGQNANKGRQQPTTNGNADKAIPKDSNLKKNEGENECNTASKENDSLDLGPVVIVNTGTSDLNDEMEVETCEVEIESSKQPSDETDKQETEEQINSSVPGPRKSAREVKEKTKEGNHVNKETPEQEQPQITQSTIMESTSVTNNNKMPETNKNTEENEKEAVLEAKSKDFVNMAVDVIDAKKTLDTGPKDKKKETAKENEVEASGTAKGITRMTTRRTAAVDSKAQKRTTRASAESSPVASKRLRSSTNDKSPKAKSSPKSTASSEKSKDKEEKDSTNEKNEKESPVPSRISQRQIERGARVKENKNVAEDNSSKKSTEKSAPAIAKIIIKSPTVKLGDKALPPPTSSGKPSEKAASSPAKVVVVAPARRNLRRSSSVNGTDPSDNDNEEIQDSSGSSHAQRKSTRLRAKKEDPDDIPNKKRSVRKIC